MNKNELTLDEQILVRDILDTITDDSDLLRGFREYCGTNKRELNRIAKKLRDTISTELEFRRVALP